MAVMVTDTTIEDLVDDVLLVIFSYLEAEDLVGSVQHVCSRWKELCSSSCLWKTITYRPDGNGDDESIINFLNDTPNLRSINFDQVIIGPEIIKTLAHNCGNITELKLGDVNPFNYESLKEVQRNCPNLEHLTVEDTIFCEAINVEVIIGEFHNLKSFIVLQGQFVSTFVNLQPIADGCPKLEHFEMSNQIRTSEEFQYFLQKKKNVLKYLGTICLTEDGHCTLPLVSICHKLNTLHINRLCNSRDSLRLSEKSISLTTFWWTLIETENVNRIMRFFSCNNLRGLREINLPFYTNFEDSLIDAIINACPLLRKLHLPECWNLSDKTLENLHQLKHLQSVDFSASKVSDDGVRFLDLCEQLHYIDLSCCNITGRVVLKMTRMERLKILILEGCHIEGISLETIPTCLRALRKLSIRCCNRIAKKDIENLRSKMPQLQVVY